MLVISAMDRRKPITTWFPGDPSMEGENEKEKKVTSPAGFEPATSGLEVQRAIHCATGTCRQDLVQFRTGSEAKSASKLVTTLKRNREPD